MGAQSVLNPWMTEMRFDKIKCAAFVPLLTIAGLAQAAGLQPFVATYEVIRNGDTLGNATVTLKQTPGGWDYESVTHGTSGLAALAAADIDEHSQVAVNAGVLETRNYHYRLKTFLKSSERDIAVDPATNRIVISDKKHTQSFPMQPGLLDQHSVTLAIAQDLANGKHGTLTYNVAGKDHVSAQRYETGKEQVLSIPTGPQRTITVSRLRDKEGGRVTASWFGLDNGFVPVKIVQTEPNGEVLEMKLLSLKR
jgi:hypothetical protein